MLPDKEIADFAQGYFGALLAKYEKLLFPISCKRNVICKNILNYPYV